MSEFSFKNQPDAKERELTYGCRTYQEWLQSYEGRLYIELINAVETLNKMRTQTHASAASKAASKRNERFAITRIKELAAGHEGRFVLIVK